MSEYNIQMNKYNALNAGYDQLYPATKIENVDGLNTALQNNDPRQWGLGTETMRFVSTAAELDAITDTEWVAYANDTTGFIDGFSETRYAIVRTESEHSNEKRQTAYCYGWGLSGTLTVIRGMTSGVWGHWKWVNPLMEPGVEYCTTKHINKQPVFTKRISFNGLDASGNKVIFLGTDEAKAAWIVSAVAIDLDDTSSETNFISIPHHNDITIGILGRWISIKWTGDYSKYTYGTIVVEYVKEAI